MERILFIMGNMGLGGAETHIMKVYRTIDRTKYQFDFVLNVVEKCYYEDEIIGLGGRIYRVTSKSKNIFQNYLDIKNIVSLNNYRVVFKCGEHALSWTEMLAAKNGGAVNRIMRSTNTKAGDSKLNNIIHNFSRNILSRLVTKKVAPSKEAAKWLFGEKNCDDVIYVKNGVDMSFYAFNEKSRIAKRKELNISNKAIVIGHVGRFNTQKNHEFLIDIFNQIHIKNPESYLLLIGEGPLKEKIAEKISKYNISEFVKFAGNRKDVNELYSAMDLFVFPSLYEGMPNTVIEAQANGLRCFVSDTITKEANITNQVQYCSLNDIKEWIDIIELESYERYDPKRFFQEEKYDIQCVVEDYMKIFSVSKDIGL